MSEQYKKLVSTLNQIFELDKADLDFGIYRILNQKRDEIKNFFENDLIPQVEKAFKGFRDSAQTSIKQELEKLENNLTEAGIDPDSSPKVQELKQKLSNSVDTFAIQNEIFSHLHRFFSRYYDKGDFISQRRYKDGVYAIPYNGEEVKLYWANYDQYYIKSSEYLKNYVFKVETHDGRKKSVSFKIVAADTEKDDRKANEKDRKFILATTDPIEEISQDELHIKFQYATGIKAKQDKLNEETLQKIWSYLQDKKLSDWQTALAQNAPTEKNPKRTILEKHIKEFTARHTFDYFIHKDLGAFLRRELDFYIKNEVLHLDDISDESLDITRLQLRKIKALKEIAHKIIRMLAQIEDFQKRLWLKKKFVYETQYCFTLDRIPRELWAEIAKNQAQWAEWKQLGLLDEDIEPSIKVMEQNQSMMVDTAHFDADFKYRLLEIIGEEKGDIDEQLDGLLVHGENFQALNLMMERYREQVKCIHIDPPYNTSTSGFLYKNNYQHSSWLTMMFNRIASAIKLLNEKGAFHCHIDENEYELLYELFNILGLPDAGTIVWDKKNPMLGRKGVATQHEYIIWRGWNDGPIYLPNKSVRMILSKAKEIIGKHGGVNKASRKEFTQWISKCPTLTGGERAYRFIDDDGRIFQSVAMGAPEPRENPKFHIPIIHPVTGKPCPVPPNGWSRSPETLQKLIEQGEILFGEDETTQPRKKVFLTNKSKRQLSSVIIETRRGKQDALALGIEFPYSHPVTLYETLVGAGTDANGLVLDFFAGSGTTAHAVINLNREDGGKRKYILVEMAHYFDTVLMPRIKKVVYSKDWKNGKPTSPDPGISHAFKYIRIESYEDTLNNLKLKQGTKAQEKTLKNPLFREDYMLGYWLDVETKDSASLLDLKAFENPFDYKMDIATKSVAESRPVTIDLIETFNWLLGLKVGHIYRQQGFFVVQGKNLDEESILIVWRNLKEHDNETLERFLEKSGFNPRDTEFDRIYVNGDHTLEDPFNKVQLIEQEFKRLMFEE